MQGAKRVGRIDCYEIEAKSVLNRVRGMPFGWSINPYRGCFHQCVFCYARRTHTFLERSGIGDWGSVLSVKVNAPLVLRHELASPRWKGEHVAIGTATDPYQPLEGRYRITRGILIELVRGRTEAHLITRSPLVVRDIDVLQDLARAAGASVCISLPTLDAELARRIEPTVAPPRQRLRAVRLLADAGIRVGVAVAPILPHLSDGEAELREVYAAAAAAGATTVWHSVLNLNDVAKESYFGFLRAEFPSLLGTHESYYRASTPRKPSSMISKKGSVPQLARYGYVRAGRSSRNRPAFNFRCSKIRNRSDLVAPSPPLAGRRPSVIGSCDAMPTNEIVLPVTKPETEWIRGRAVQKVSPKRDHSRVQGQFLIALSAWSRGRGEVGPEWRFRIAVAGEPRRPLVPDVAFVSYERLRGYSLEEIQAPAFAPNVAIEVFSAGDKRLDVASKIDVYVRAGCELVVVAYPETRTMTLHDAASSTTLSADGTLRHAALPGFVLPLAQFFADALDLPA